MTFNTLLNLIRDCGYELDVEDFGDSFDVDVYASGTEGAERHFLYTLYSRQRK